MASNEKLTYFDMMRTSWKEKYVESQQKYVLNARFLNGSQILRGITEVPWKTVGKRSRSIAARKRVIAGRFLHLPVLQALNCNSRARFICMDDIATLRRSCSKRENHRTVQEPYFFREETRHRSYESQLRRGRLDEASKVG